MATSPKKPVIPPVLRATKEIVQFAEKTREAVGVLQGQRGNELDRAVTFRDALGDDFLKNLREGFRGIGGVPAEGDNNFDVPPIPTGFTGRAGFEYAVLSWDEPTYPNHAYTEVYWHDSDDISAATKYGSAFGALSVFLVDMDIDTTKFFWIRFVSTAGVAGQFNSTSGLELQTAINVTKVLTALTNEIREDQLFSDLADKIDLIEADSTVVGSVNARIATETAARQSAITSLQASIADLEGLPTWASGTSYAIDDLVKYNGAIYKCIQATSSVVPTNTSYWEKIGEYDSLGGAIAGVASDLSDVTSRVDDTEDGISALSQSLTQLSSTVNNTTTGLTSKASAASLTQAVSNIYGAQVSAFTEIDAKFDSVDTAVGNRATIQQLNEAKTDIYSSAVSQFTNINAQFGTVNSALQNKATSLDLTNAVANIYASNVTQFTTIAAKFGEVDDAIESANTAIGNRATSQQLTDAIATAKQAAVTEYTNINAAFNSQQEQINARATIEQLNTAKSTIYASQVSQFSNINARFSSQDGAINGKAGVTQMNEAIALAKNAAIATATQQVYSTLGGDAAYVETQAQSWDGAGARWTTKTQVGELVGGIGILNDGTSTRLYIQADRFAIYDSSLPTNTDDLVPFIVTGGKTYIKTAAIQDATIEVAKIKDGFLDNLTAAYGTLAAARIGIANIFDLSIGDKIQSSNFSSGTSGWRILRNGSVEFNGGIFRGAVRFLTSTDAANARADLNVANGADKTSENTAAAISGQGSLATQSSVAWQNQVSGYGKPGDFADKTSENTAANIANQGALATSNSADYRTQVSGNYKPDEYADVTASHTSYDTARVAGSIASSVRDQASAGAYASSRVNTWTRPTSTLIDGNKIFTGDAYVDTLQIKGNAVIVPAYDDLSISSIYVNNYYTGWVGPTNGLPQVTVTLDVPGRIILMWFTRTNAQGSGATNYNVRLLQGSTQIEYIPSFNTGAVHSGTIQRDLAAGTYTFSMEVKAFQVYLYDASIIAMGVQR